MVGKVIYYDNLYSVNYVFNQAYKINIYIYAVFRIDNEN